MTLNCQLNAPPIRYILGGQNKFSNLFMDYKTETVAMCLSLSTNKGIRCQFLNHPLFSFNTAAVAAPPTSRTDVIRSYWIQREVKKENVLLRYWRVRWRCHKGGTKKSLRYPGIVLETRVTLRLQSCGEVTLLVCVGYCHVSCGRRRELSY